MHHQIDDSADQGRRSLLAMVTMAPALAVAGAADAADSSGGREAGLLSELAQAINDYDQATFSNDTAALDRIVTEDYMLVNSDSSVQNKEQYLEDFRVPGFRLEPYVMQQPMRKLWGKTALTGGVLPLSWTQDGERHARLLRIAHVWVRRNEQWQLAYTQLTRVPGEPGPA